MPPPADPHYDPQAYRKPSNNNWIWILLGALGVCGCGGGLILVAVLYPVFLQARMAAQRTSCLSNLRRMASATQMYATDNDDTLPHAATWAATLESNGIRERYLHCPVLRARGGYGYAMNSALSQKKLGKLDKNLVLYFETADARENAASDPDKTPFPNRHTAGRTQVILDGAAIWVKGSQGSTSP